MKKILSIGQDQITSGLSKGKHNQKSGIWYSAPGLNPFINDDDLIGTIAVSSAPTDITGAVVVDTPIAATSRSVSSTEGTMYILGDEGHLYTVDLNGNNAPVDQRSATPISASANGLVIFKGSGDPNPLSVDTSTIALWHLDGAVASAEKLDNAEGTASRDLVETGTPPTASTGKVTPTSNGSAAFTNAANKAYFVTDANFTSFPTGTCTFDFWIRRSDDTPSDTEGILTKYKAAGSNLSFGIIRNVANKIGFYISSDGVTLKELVSDTAIPALTWTHVACVFTASTRMEIFINGVSNSSTTTSVPASIYNGTGDFYIGNYESSIATASNAFDGELDDIRISNIARTASDFQQTIAQRLLYYFQQSQIGSWDMTGTYPTGWSDGTITGLESTPYHPSHQLFDGIYYGNKFNVGRLYDSGAGTASNDAAALDLPTDLTITCLSDDGQNLVIGATKNLGSSTIFSESKVYFWDTNANSWQKEYSIPSPTINALGKIGTTLYALCGKDLYAFNFSTPPVLVRSVGENDMPQFAQSQAIDTLGEGIIWGGVGTLQSFGKLSPEAKNAFWEPFTGVSDTVSMIFTDAKSDTMFVGTSTPKLWRYNTATNGYNAETLQTIFFDLKARYKVQQLEFIMPSGQASGDVAGVSLITPTGTVACTTVSYASKGNVDYVKVVPAQAVETQTLSISLTLSAGAPTIGRIDIWGEPVNHQ